MNQTQQEAEEIAEEIGIPIKIEDTREFLSQDGFTVTYKEEAMATNGFLGISLGDSNSAGVIVNSNIPDLNRKRFTAIHEFGHVSQHIFPGIKNSFQCKKDDFSNRKGVLKYEKEANDFASSMLLPQFWLKPLVKRNDLIWSFIKEISTKAEASLQATARRLIDLSNEEYALIIQYNYNVWTPIKSPPNKHFIGKTKFPSTLEKVEIINDRNYPDSWSECDADEWFSTKVPFDSVKYSSIYYPDFKLTMTILYFPEVDSWEEEDDKWEEPHF